jgi:uncharacterized membrane protein YccC
MFEDQVQALEEAREAIATQEKELKTQISGLRAQRIALDRALAALKQAQGGRPPKPKKDWGKTKQAWIPSQKILDSVLQALREHGEMSVSAAAKAAGNAPETTRKALNVLRERELVRLSATRGPQNGAIYAPMPNGGSN